MVTRSWSFENISTDLIELDWVNNRLTFDHDNIEIDTKVFSFGKSRRSVWRKAIKTPQINFRIAFGNPKVNSGLLMEMCTGRLRRT